MQKKDKKAPGTADITMKSELKKVIWPTGKQTFKSTATTIAFVALITITLVALDFGFNKLSSWYYGAILGTDAHTHDAVQSGDVSGDLEKLLESLLSGDLSGEFSGEVSTVSGEQAE